MFVDSSLFSKKTFIFKGCSVFIFLLCSKNPHIRRIAYLCKHEFGCLVGAGTSLRQKIKEITGRDTYVAECEEIRKSDRANSVGRASYVERNQWVINDSDSVVAYLRKYKGILKSETLWLV